MELLYHRVLDQLVIHFIDINCLARCGDCEIAGHHPVNSTNVSYDSVNFKIYTIFSFSSLVRFCNKTQIVKIAQ